MGFQFGERVVVEDYGPGEVIGHLSDACIIIRFDSGIEMGVHISGVRKESETEVRSERRD